MSVQGWLIISVSMTVFMAVIAYFVWKVLATEVKDLQDELSQMKDENRRTFSPSSVRILPSDKQANSNGD